MCSQLHSTLKSIEPLATRAMALPSKKHKVMELNSGKSHGLGLWRCFCPRNQKNAMAAEEVMEKKKIHGGRVISHEEEGGVLRLKIVMSKKQFKQMQSSMEKHHSSSEDYNCREAPQSLEHLLHALQSQRSTRLEMVNNNPRGGWMPALHSIPEEL